MSPSIYRSLDRDAHQIRLLSPVASPHAESGTRWKLTTFALDVSPPFAALSYLWGDSKDTVDISINGELMTVTSSLACALRHIQQQWRHQFPGRGVEEFRLWVDALCINQDDIAERGHQVKLMGRLYSAAELVMGSLGPSNESIKLAIDTLLLVHSEVQGLDDDESLEASVNWMQKHTVLTEADVGLPGDQFDANKSWKALREFLYMQYWRRAWIVQEVVLAKRLLFFAEDHALDPEALFTTLQWFKTTRQIAAQQNARRPAWLIPSVWNFLTYDNLLGWKAVLRIEWARTSDRDSRFYKLLLSCAGNDLRATDPRDLIYGTMGLTKMGFEPDYSPTSSLGRLYAMFMAWWLEQVTALQAEDEDWTLNHLDLLGQAGVGQVDDDDENTDLARCLPSWAPNFPLHGKIYTPHILTSQKDADGDIFPADAPIPRVQDLSLFVPAIILDSVTAVNKVKTTKKASGLLGFVVSYVLQHKSYPNRCQPLQGVFRSLMKDILGDADPQDQDVMIRFFGFIRALIHGPETGVIKMKPEEALQRLGFSTASAAEFAYSFREVYLRDMSTDTVAWAQKWLLLLLQPAWDGDWQDPGVLDLCLRTVLEIRELDYASIATTAKGYLGVVPIGTKVGDELCLLHKSDCASVVRERNGYWEHVGRCYSFGLSEKRDEEFVKGLAAYKMLEFR
ncbi:D-arabinitol 2-dehydrogenase [Purpureocillium lavendulum]|uniref:D-arabinitol 2-dehydrogenase n=1 Tax=Purpureocillium lavendulum TaxID=1247861 RepID=A0AB34G2H0_9HYPO|nr:D-arabinitol 2-dehydrogenase [Purpureocillium lavendulum]